MIDPYFGYVLAAYVIALGAAAGLVVYAVADRRAARRELGRAERAAERLAAPR